MIAGTEDVELVTMAGVFEAKLEGSLKLLRNPKYAARHAGIPEMRAEIDRFKGGTT